MSAKEYYESKAWGNPHWDRKTASQFDKSEMLDFTINLYVERDLTNRDKIVEKS